MRQILKLSPLLTLISLTHAENVNITSWDDEAPAFKIHTCINKVERTMKILNDGRTCEDYAMDTGQPFEIAGRALSITSEQSDIQLSTGPGGWMNLNFINEPGVNCGVNHNYNDMERVVGGYESRFPEYPWFVKLQSCACSSAHCTSSNNLCKRCGGSIISQHFILTAAHCIDHSLDSHGLYLNNPSFGLAGGAHDQDYGVETDWTTFTQVYRNVLWYVSYQYHPAWNNNAENGNDIGLIQYRPDDPNFFTRWSPSYVFPVCLPKVDTCVSGGTLDNGLSGDKLWSAGYGRVEFMGNYAPRLKKVDIMSIEKSNCETVYPFVANIDSITCAGGNVNNWNTCQGDSGGALLYQSERNHYYQYGVVSFGPANGCGITGFPSGFTRVTQNLYWIRLFSGVVSEDGDLTADDQLTVYGQNVCREENVLYNYHNTGNTEPRELLSQAISNIDIESMQTSQELADAVTRVGCWCPKFAAQNEFLPVWHGASLDAYDHLCKEFSRCVNSQYTCESKECYGQDITSDEAFEWKVERSGEYICRGDNGSACGRSLCQCYMNWATGIAELIQNGNGVVVSQYSPSNVNSDICTATSGSTSNIINEGTIDETSVDDFGGNFFGDVC